MSRVKRAVAGRKKRQTLVERTKGYYGTSSRTFRGMKEQAQHSGQYQYRMHGLKLAGVELDRKVLAEIAYSDEKAFADLANVAKKALADAE